jgi:predicted transcriptional regulator
MDYAERMHIEEGPAMPTAQKEAYVEGLKAGITLYAYWKDGVQYVGTSGKTLKEALERAKRSLDDAPPEGSG